MGIVGLAVLTLVIGCERERRAPAKGSAAPVVIPDATIVGDAGFTPVRGLSTWAGSGLEGDMTQRRPGVDLGEQINPDAGTRPKR